MDRGWAGRLVPLNTGSNIKVKFWRITAVFHHSVRVTLTHVKDDYSITSDIAQKRLFSRIKLIHYCAWQGEDLIKLF
ncbi:hypothetical protein BW686_21740 [Pseudomonas syringae]|uniref:Uncharacterized protein n=1 Tax=Pseudomonas syringae TaxID=317 RepID=A0A244ELF7_PSESX|nr:hypothetical protein BW686_21740 [Pseudomonas syringae]